jgi:hypothetical protein
MNLPPFLTIRKLQFSELRASFAAGQQKRSVGTPT